MLSTNKQPTKKCMESCKNYLLLLNPECVDFHTHIIGIKGSVWECSSVAECFLIVHKALSLVVLPQK